MNPYEANPDKIPESDRFADVPLYGRYDPQPGDFKPEQRHLNSTTPESLEYWEGVLKLCDTTVRIYENTDGGRDVFALGSVIVKSSHLKTELKGRRACRDYALADANEVKATTLVRGVVKDIAIPEILFADKIHGRDVLVQSRIPGVGLNIAWQYLAADKKASFKEQARDFLRLLNSQASPFSEPSYLVPDSEPTANRGIQEKEAQILFRGSDTGDLGLMHNDLTHSNIIVDNDKIVGVVDWEMAGYFGWERAAEVHLSIRSLTRECFAHLDLDEEFLLDIIYWNDLYDATH
ncbi:hypothetical protein FQN49_001967 [Arthroderma sp. PD_2]|nr:hypothetical protein FQN49_001967 [Arthroderma sp. PD_2]